MSIDVSRPPLGDLIDPFGESKRLPRSGTGLRRSTTSFRAARWAPLALALVAAAFALAGSLRVFPLLSENNDEAVYLLQADALRHGMLFPPAPENWEAFLPALSVYRDGRYIPKYAPVHAGLIAMGDAVTGSPRGALALIAAVAAATSYLLAKQILRRRRPAIFAAAFFVMSPLTVIQSGTYLSYLSALAVLQGSAAALVAGVKRRSPKMLCLSGLLLGVAVFARPYEAFLFAGPFVFWLLWIHRRSFRRIAWAGGWLGLGSLFPLLAMFAYFYEATGSLTKLPFNLLHPSDTVGFGSRRMYPTSPATFYTPRLAWAGMRAHLDLLASWSFGGLGLAGFAVAGALKMKSSNPGRWLALVLITVPAGYFFFWGSFGSIRWGAPFRLGPFYYLPMLTPLTILGAAGFDWFWASRRRLAVAAALAMLVFSSVTLTRAVRANIEASEARKLLYGPLLTHRLQNAIVFLPRLTGSSLLTHPFALARNDPALSGDVVWALDRGPAANREILAAFAGRVSYSLKPVGQWRPHGRGRPSRDFRTVLEPFPEQESCAESMAESHSHLCLRLGGKATKPGMLEEGF